ncbi:AAA family ATPase [Halofilum ochraceum]|uniref:AAA family ATPase n=1 Tax=Halofilum ochraceum TaxID=1611323 RepID=UPI000829C5B3|nr:MoxR family ATPase [Halofilum ochraceum]
MNDETVRTELPESIDATVDLLNSGAYVADRRLATALFLSLRMGRPLFLEGEAGVGKTEIAKVAARTLGRPLVRLQCYEGLDITAAVYEWNYQRQMVEIRLAEASGEVDRERLGRDIFDRRFLTKRALLQALEPEDGVAPVLLIDELDRTDEPFEAYLLEVLSDFQVTIPEIGTIVAREPPIVVVTSNRTREIHDAVKRRCLYHWVDYPDAERELEILRLKAPDAPAELSRQVVAFVQELRQMDLYKLPGIAETIDWTNALIAVDSLSLDPAVINDTLGALLKYQDDIARFDSQQVNDLLQRINAGVAASSNA